MSGEWLVIFDCDGVLVDSEPLIQRVEMAMIAKLGWPITQEEVHAEHLGRSWPAIQANIERHIGRPLPVDFRVRSIAAKDALFRSLLRPVPGVVTAFESFDRAGYTTCVASSGVHQRIRVVLEVTNLLDTFDGRIFSAEDVENGKPAPDLFLHAAAQMGFNPSKCVVIEDSPAGIAGARAAGMAVIGYAGRTPRQLLSDAHVTLDDMSKLPATVEAIALAG